MENINDAANRYVKRVRRSFEMNDLGEQQDLCIQSNKLLLGSVH